GKDPVEATRTLEVVELPEVTSFTATPSTYTPGDPAGVVLEWASTGGVSVTIHTVVGGSVSGAPLFEDSTPAAAASGTHVVFPAAATTYRVTVKNAAGDEDTADAQVQVQAPGTGIIDFSTQTPTVTAGSVVTLDWNTTGGTVYLEGMVEVPAANAPFLDVRTMGLQLLPNACSTASPLDEGCIEFSIPGGNFAFPYEGVPRTSARIYVNGFVSFDPGPGVFETFDPVGLPSTTDSYAHIAPFWSDLYIDSAWAWPETGIFGALNDLDPVDPHIILQWNRTIDPLILFLEGDATDMSFNLVAFESGSFEFRYGTMWGESGIADRQPRADGEHASIGYQNTSGTEGFMLNPGLTPVPGGLSNRTFRAERNAPPVGSLDVVVRQTTTFELCVDDGTTPVCQTLTVTVN
ncbi:MAG TPA: hypothetical protein VN033_00170, partial [Vulgatibacter sp.]|nr:hypothetical protein [Vulgatibacter sp.]